MDYNSVQCITTLFNALWFITLDVDIVTTEYLLSVMDALYFIFLFSSTPNRRTISFVFDGSMEKIKVKKLDRYTTICY